MITCFAYKIRKLPLWEHPFELIFCSSAVITEVQVLLWLQAVLPLRTSAVGRWIPELFNPPVLEPFKKGYTGPVYPINTVPTIKGVYIVFGVDYQETPIPRVFRPFFIMPWEDHMDGFFDEFTCSSKGPFFGEASTASTDTSLGRYTGLDKESQHDINHEPCRFRSHEHPRCYMCGIFTYTLNVGKYTIHIHIMDPMGYASQLARRSSPWINSLGHVHRSMLVTLAASRLLVFKHHFLFGKANGWMMMDFYA